MPCFIIDLVTQTRCNLHVKTVCKTKRVESLYTKARDLASDRYVPPPLASPCARLAPSCSTQRFVRWLVSNRVGENKRFKRWILTPISSTGARGKGGPPILNGNPRNLRPISLHKIHDEIPRHCSPIFFFFPDRGKGRGSHNHPLLSIHLSLLESNVGRHDGKSQFANVHANSLGKYREHLFPSPSPRDGG